MKQAVVETLAPKKIKYDYDGVREAFGFFGDGLRRSADKQHAVDVGLCAIIRCPWSRFAVA
ncbi:hypothetical protein [uncultured Ruegeria sp.]|uniref:hypothetical protein n=1 Tax=uncultured Ruegeria sp. TaxID=259304 RepID=UPI00260A13EC|nr:hypothetical protein [uncultured Ruegeria sp.]